MVIPIRQKAKERGLLITDMVVAMGILAIAMVPIAFTTLSESRDFRATYQKAVAMEIVDGEIEILAAGAWRDFPEGTHNYTVHANAATNLPPGEFKLIRNGQHVRLEWASEKKRGIGPVFREVTIK